jgi:hypothetical protein
LFCCVLLIVISHTFISHTFQDFFPYFFCFSLPTNLILPLAIANFWVHPVRILAFSYLGVQLVFPWIYPI